MLLHLLEAIAIGFLMNAPVGALGIICIKYTLRGGYIAGVTCGLGVAIVDGLYSAIALLGLTGISDFLMRQHVWLALVSGFFLLYLGWKTFRSTPTLSSDTAVRPSLAGGFLTTFFLAATHPATILVYMGALSQMLHRLDAATARLMVAGIFGGSLLWWLLFATFILRIPRAILTARLQWINRISACLLIALGLWMLLLSIHSY